MRPPLRVWIWTAATLVVAVVAVLLWQSSSVAATSSTTTTATAPQTGQPAAQLSSAWTAPTTTAASGELLQNGRELTTDEHGVALLDATTGTEAWHYERSSATLCGATAVDELVVAVYRTSDRCNEAVALRVDTGVRKWTRTLNFRSDITVSSTDEIVLAATSTGVATIDATGDGTRWRHAADEGCTVVDAAAGSAGVALVQRCSADSVRVQLLDGFAGSVTWTKDVPTGGSPVQLVGADGLVDVLVGDAVHVLAPADGSELQQLALPALTGGQTAADEPVQQTELADTALLWLRGTAYALDSSTGATRWRTAATGLPALQTGAADAATVGLVENGSYVQRSLTDGRELARSTGLPADLPAGGRTWQSGPVVLYATGTQVLAFS